MKTITIGKLFRLLIIQFHLLCIGFLIYLIGYIFTVIVTNLEIGICGNNTFNPTSALNTTALYQEPCAGEMLGALIIM